MSGARIAEHQRRPGNASNLEQHRQVLEFRPWVGQKGNEKPHTRSRPTRTGQRFP